MATIPSHVDVAVVGAGPAGLAAACILRKAGVNAIVLDAAAEPTTASRATVIHSRTLEVLESIGLTEKILEEGDKVTTWNIRDESSILVDLDFSSLDAKYPCVVTLPQSRTEALLRQRLDQLGGAIYSSARVTGLVDNGEDVRLEVSTPTPEGKEAKSTIVAGYIIAADGVKSTVRSAMDISFEGGEYDASFIAVDCKFSSNGPLKPNAVQLFLSTDGLLLFIPQPNGLWRLVATLDQAPKEADRSLCQAICDKRVGAGNHGVKIEEVVWWSRFHIHHRLAGQYRKGRVFLVGDAAHVHSPAGGQGLNISIQDGMRLGEIISEALRDHKNSDAELDRYEAERRPVAKGVVAMTHRITLMATMKSPFWCRVRNWLLWGIMSLPFARAFITRKIAELEH